MSPVHATAAMATMTFGEFLLAESGSLALLGGLLAAGAFFSGAETALFSLSRGQLYRLGQDSSRLARLVPALMRHPDNVLTTVLLGTNVTRILYFVLSTLVVMRAKATLAGGAAPAAALAVAAPLAVIVFSEILPKTVCYIAAWRLARLAAPVLAGAGWLLGPVQRFLMAALIEPLTRLLAPRQSRRVELGAEELASLLTLSESRGLIGSSETDLLKEVLQLSDLRAGDIMVPRVDMVAYEVSGSADGLIERIRSQRITKIPVYEGNLDNVIGVVHAKRLLVNEGQPLRELLAPVQFVPEVASLERVLVQFRATGSQLAIVVDEYGGTAGLVTLEDVLEEIVGEIVEEGDAERGPAVRRVGEGEWLVDGSLPIHEWADAFPGQLETARYTTVGGFVIALLGHIPQVGESATYGNVTFTVEATRRRRVSLLRVCAGEGGP